jgi:uncharacterized protein (TIGR03083 family)
METSRYLACLRHDAARLRAVAADNPELPVPSCPDWTVADLVAHVAQAYQHKTECIRQGKLPKPWPPPPTGAEPVEEFDRSLAELLAEFDKHQPTDRAATWYDPDQSVGFWIRRMAQETVIHRVDAELAISDVTAVPTDLALDGIAEVLGIFLGWASVEDVRREGPDSWPALASTDERVVVVRAGDSAWSVRPTPQGVQVSPGATPDPAATVSGDPVDLLLWLWRRGGDDKLAVHGDPRPVSALHDLMHTATQ